MPTEPGGTRSNATTPGGSKHGTYEASSAIGSGTVGHGNPGEAATGGRGDSSGTVVDDSIRELVNMGWRESAAKTVVAYNVKMLTILYEEDRRQWQVLLRGRLKTRLPGVGLMGYRPPHETDLLSY
jgi:hypothetical protein